jgi:hypothetical protein
MSEREGEIEGEREGERQREREKERERASVSDRDRVQCVRERQ